MDSNNSICFVEFRVEIGDDIRSTRSTCSWRAEVNSGIVKGAEFLRDQILLYKTKPIISNARPEQMTWNLAQIHPMPKRESSR
ncbi:hypothetical protein GQX74_006666 [Glossina fuscipes]|nr:hypothetical protein GQX74_006666 [Glossina fuscipes]